MKGYKGFDKDLKCRGFQYEVGKKYKHEGDIEMCSEGFHFCKTVMDIHIYYDLMSEDIRVCEVDAEGKIIEGSDKCVTDTIKIVRELTKEEIEEFKNVGKGNTGVGNTGGRNTTDRSTGCFCTEKQPMKFFDKKSDMTWEQWRDSQAYYILMRIPKNIWVDWEDMTEEEQSHNPKAKTTGGFMRELDLKEEAEKWWADLDDKEKEIIRAIPNFNRAKFRKIMGGAKIG